MGRYGRCNHFLLLSTISQNISLTATIPSHYRVLTDVAIDIWKKLLPAKCREIRGLRREAGAQTPDRVCISSPHKPQPKEQQMFQARKPI